MSARIPYGYQIVNGKARKEPEQVEKLFRFRTCYLEGYSLKKAAKIAEIERTWMCCRDMLVNPIYLGNDYYPPIFTREEIEECRTKIRERGAHLRGKTGKPVRRAIPIQTEFHIIKTEEKMRNHPQEHVAWLYRSIVNGPVDSPVVHTKVEFMEER